jgi:hypothetical protein
MVSATHAPASRSNAHFVPITWGYTGVNLQVQSHEDPRQSILWAGKVDVLEAPRVQPSRFYSLLCEEPEYSNDDMNDATPQEADGQQEGQARSGMHKPAS